MPLKQSPSVGFSPLAAPDARVLILGSLPGRMSLERGERYAHPQNAFWKIMGELVGASPTLPYAKRTKKLVEAGIALWDVCYAAIRAGSLDSDIREPQINDFNTFFKTHRHIKLVCLNGMKASDLYRKKVVPHLFPSARDIRTETLPSTSPANAQMRFAQKLERWQNTLANA